LFEGRRDFLENGLECQMNRKVFVFGVSVTALGLAASLGATTYVVTGCSSSPDNSSSGGGSGGGSGGSSGGAAISCPKDALLIDDMSGLHTTGTALPGGYWFTYDDRTNPYSEPPIFLTGEGGAPLPGMVTPNCGTQFMSSTDSHLMLPMGLPAAREAVGGGQSNWGAGMGFDVNDTKPDGGNTIPFWGCDGGAPGQVGSGSPADWSDAPDSGNGIPITFDGSPHKGVSFYAISLTPNPQPVQVKFSEYRTNSWGPTFPAIANEQTCNACATKLYQPTAQCGDDYLVNEDIGTTWSQYVIHWPDLKTQNWSKVGLPAGGFDPAHWVSMHFQFHTSAGVPLPSFDVAVACLRFVDQ
jgi:hypothetical protein